MCGPKRKHPASDEDDDVAANTTTTGAAVMSFFATGVQPPALRPVDMIAAAPAPSDPVIVYTGPTRTGAAIAAAAEADAARDAPPKAGKRSKIAHGKPNNSLAAKTEAKTEAATDTKAKHRASVTIKPGATAKPSAAQGDGAKAANAKATNAKAANAKAAPLKDAHTKGVRAKQTAAGAAAKPKPAESAKSEAGQ
jgi:D-alanyl-D-alanine carboxypeptidase